MNEHEDARIENRIKQLLQQALPPVDANAEPGRDLWPAVLRRLDARSSAQSRSLSHSLHHSLPWFDWALLAGLVLFAAIFPATIPVFLYYL